MPRRSLEQSRPKRQTRRADAEHPSSSRAPLRSNADRNIALRGEPDGTRRKRVRPADGGGAEKHARVAFVEEDLAARTAGSLGNDTLSPIASGAPSRVPDPLSPQPDQVAAERHRASIGGHATAGGDLVGTPAAGVRLQSEHRSGNLGSKLCAAAWRAKTSVQTAQRQIGRTGEAAVPGKAGRTRQGRVGPRRTAAEQAPALPPCCDRLCRAAELAEVQRDDLAHVQRAAALMPLRKFAAALSRSSRRRPAYLPPSPRRPPRGGAWRRAPSGCARPRTRGSSPPRSPRAPRGRAKPALPSP